MKWILRILFILAAGGVLLVVLVLSLFGLALSMLRWLFTGQKPQVAVAFQTYRKWQRQASQQMYRSNPDADVIEAQVREVMPEPSHKPQLGDKP